MTPTEVCKIAKDSGFNFIETFLGDVTLEFWAEISTLKDLSLENGRIVSEWLPSILEKGMMERLVFILK
jgi:hypothetical protein